MNNIKYFLRALIMVPILPVVILAIGLVALFAGEKNANKFMDKMNF